MEDEGGGLRVSVFVFFGVPCLEQPAMRGLAGWPVCPRLAVHLKHLIFLQRSMEYSIAAVIAMIGPTGCSNGFETIYPLEI